MPPFERETPMILACHHISKAFGEVSVLKDVTFNIEDHEKAALIGINGAGKTTLFNIITGGLTADSGMVSAAKGISIGSLSQDHIYTEQQTILETIMEVKADVWAVESRLRELEVSMQHAAGDELSSLMEQYSRLDAVFEQKNGYAAKSEVTGILHGLGFSDEEFDTKVSSLSGGEKTRLFLGRLLLTHPDIILLDEPTNHLDMDSVAWLETFLRDYDGSVLVISHDRYFINSIATKIIELENGVSTTFRGDYSDYARKKAELRNARLKEYLAQQAEIKHEEEVIRKLKSFNREKSVKRAESREKKLAKMEPIERPAETGSRMRIRLEPGIMSGKDVLTIRGLSKAYGQNVLFSNADIEIKRGEHVAVIGRNGTGKTTLLKIINGLISADSGSVKTGTLVNIGYYDQEQQNLCMEKTLFDELQDSCPDMDDTSVRNTLAAFLFTGDDVFKRVSDLSGGERGRLSLAKLMISESNLLILDEPTNHLDIVSREILEDALMEYTGTVLYVSHDRYFINRTAHRILELSGGVFTNYAGDYDHYLEKRAVFSPAVGPDQAKKASASKEEWQRDKEEQARQRKLANDIKKAEAQIEALEAEGAQIDSMLADPANGTDVPLLLELSTKKEQNEKRLSELYELWESLSEQ